LNTRTIRLLENYELPLTMPLIQLLNPSLTEQVLRERMDAMPAFGYHCVGVFDGDVCIGCCGFWVLLKYYAGKHIEPDNVVIHPDYRSQGIGEQMIRFVEQYAKEIGCEGLELNAYTTNHAGQKFWMNQGYKIVGFHMQKKI
jgi:diamine N-acetyltransferase